MELFLKPNRLVFSVSICSLTLNIHGIITRTSQETPIRTVKVYMDKHLYAPVLHGNNRFVAILIINICYLSEATCITYMLAVLFTKNQRKN